MSQTPKPIDLSLTESDVERILHSLSYHYGMTDNTEEDDRNKAVIERIKAQVLAQTQGDNL
ncbi:hypothetical protein YA0089_27890 [Pseudomonas viridiflava]|uniref:hypothetical protein n=1 Tax=Pseudomonas viridiflava TaxID=33069 RepID=UPI0018E5B8B4|nr:hypothetical protein [Pseudomonas viridiflava]MBI6727443.1 hypothetical protein [Pseudomonas viridiflava]